jgi:hypothetical protein
VDLILLTIGVIVELASLGAAVHIWRQPGRTAVKGAWTTMVLIPFLGIVAFAVWHEPPPVSDPTSADRGPARRPSPPGEPRPLQREPRAVPADHRLWLHDEWIAASQEGGS